MLCDTRSERFGFTRLVKRRSRTDGNRVLRRKGCKRIGESRKHQSESILLSFTYLMKRILSIIIVPLLIIHWRGFLIYEKFFLTKIFTIWYILKCQNILCVCYILKIFNCFFIKVWISFNFSFGWCIGNEPKWLMIVKWGKQNSKQGRQERKGWNFICVFVCINNMLIYLLWKRIKFPFRKRGIYGDWRSHTERFLFL